jgi:hypothetical protein
MRRSRLRLAVGLLTLALLGFAAAGPALALQINAVYDSSVSSRSDYQQIKSAFGQAADAWSNVLTDNVTVNIRVSFGGVGGYVLGPTTLGGSLDALYGYFSYSQMKSWLSSDASSSDDKTAVKSLPAGSTVAGNTFVLASAQAKALGLISGKNSAYDGYIGFGSATKYDYDRSNGISAGYYDFVGLAEHEMAHVLGLFSGLGDGYATAFDLFRCSGGASELHGRPLVLLHRRVQDEPGHLQQHRERRPRRLGLRAHLDGHPGRVPLPRRPVRDLGSRHDGARRDRVGHQVGHRRRLHHLAAVVQQHRPGGRRRRSSRGVDAGAPERGAARPLARAAPPLRLSRRAASNIVLS